MCSITVTAAVFDQNQNTLTVSGTSDCQSIVFSMPEMSIVGFQINVVSGTWEVIFNSSQFTIPPGFSCGQGFKYDAQCIDTPNCSVSNSIAVTCAVPPVVCPQLALEILDTSVCNPEGERTVIFRATSSLNDVTAVFDFGDDSQSLSIDFLTNTSPTFTHDYSSGSYIATLEILTPRDCQDKTIDVIVGDCPSNDTPSPNCPNDIVWELEDANGNTFKVVDTIEGIYQQINNNPNEDTIDCLQAGSYTLRLTEPSGNGFDIFWRHNDVTVQATTFQIDIASGEEEEIAVTVTQDGCFPLPETLILKACGCIETEWSDWSECVNCEQTRERIGADCLPEIETRSCAGESAPTSFTNWTPAGFCRLVRSMRDRNCVTIVETRINWCCIWLIVNLFLIVATVIAFVIAGCVYQWAETIATTTAIVIGIITIVSWVLWSIICIFLQRRNPVITCRSLLIVIEILEWAETLAAIITLVLAAFGMLPCAFAIAVNWALIAAIKKYLRIIAQIIGCLPSPFFRNRLT